MKDKEMALLRILAIIVLYKRTPEESETFTSLREILLKRTDMSEGIRLLVYDNSPVSQEIPPLPIATQYVSDITNGGLVSAYNCGLQLADEAGIDWLLLLDQDTVLTESYLVELISTLPKVKPPVCAVLPKLAQSHADIKVMSPHFMPRLTHQGIDAAFTGIAEKELTAFNSAAAIRLSSLKAIGGFPTEHSIEFLDHAVFHQLQKAGGKVWVMDSILSHNFSSATPGISLSFDRYKNILYAERDFYKNHENLAAYIWYRLRTFKQSIGHLIKVKDKRFAIWDLRAALGALGQRFPEKR